MIHQVPARFIPADYRQCSLTVMDNITDPGIYFDTDGISNYYHDYFRHLPAIVKDPALAEAGLEKILERVKREGKGKDYDCIIGVSGGVDSTYVALKVKEWGLRPLAVHFDNGWNSELAVKNIENIVTRLGFDLYTHVFDWQQFRDLQLSHIKAHVVDIEGITDVAIHSVLVSLATRNKVKHILSGYNYVTESILPSAWVFKDYYNIMDIHRKYGTVPVTLFPYFSSFKERVRAKFLRLQYHHILNYIQYDKQEAKEEIKKQLGWVDYGGKHYESVFTRFYQGYILPNKFGIDKRKAHLSNLICSGQLSKAEALKELEEPVYNPSQLLIDKEFVLKKLGYSEEEFAVYLQAPPVSHQQFDTHDKHAGRNKLMNRIRKQFR
jgi:N-acetyl sugar amidotransferase